MASEVVLWTRARCHLCDEVRPALEAVCADEGATLTVRDVDADAEAREQYTDMVPVVIVDGVMHGFLRVNVERVRAAIRGLT